MVPGSAEGGSERGEREHERLRLITGGYRRPSIGFETRALRAFKRIAPGVGLRLIRAALLVAYTTPTRSHPNVTFRTSSRGFELDCRFDTREAMLVVQAVRITD